MSSSQVRQGLSLMIPRVFPQWVDEQNIIDIFHKQHLGRVYKVSIIRCRDSKSRDYPIYQAFIYFSAWYENEIAYNFQQRIYGPKKQARVVYDDPWYWLAFENTKRRLSNNDKRLMRVGYQTYLNEQVSDQKFITLEREMHEEREQKERKEREWKEKYDEEMREILEKQQEIRQWFHDFNTRYENVMERKTEMLERIAQRKQAQQAEQQQQVPVANWNPNAISGSAMQIINEELELTETAMRVAESALSITPEMEDEEEDMRVIEELGLTETAMRVAEAALYDDNDDDMCGESESDYEEDYNKYDYPRW